jgi:hypothetical protein
MCLRSPGEHRFTISISGFTEITAPQICRKTIKHNKITSCIASFLYSQKHACVGQSPLLPALLPKHINVLKRQPFVSDCIVHHFAKALQQ